MNFNQQQQQLIGAVAPISAPTKKDVLQGRGQGVQRHPGNVKYRTLVFVNKVSTTCILYVLFVLLWCFGIELRSCLYVLYCNFSASYVCMLGTYFLQYLYLIIKCICSCLSQGLYAKCPRTDKIKISKVSYCRVLPHDLFIIHNMLCTYYNSRH